MISSACGRMIRRMRLAGDMLSASAASHWPRGTDRMRAAHQLGAVGAEVHADGDEAGGELLQRHAEERQDEEDPVELHQQRRAAENLDIDGGGAADCGFGDSCIRPGHQRHRDGEDRRQQELGSRMVTSVPLRKARRRRSEGIRRYDMPLRPRSGQGAVRAPARSGGPHRIPALPLSGWRRPIRWSCRPAAELRRSRIPPPPPSSRREPRYSFCAALNVSRKSWSALRKPMPAQLTSVLGQARRDR